MEHGGGVRRAGWGLPTVLRRRGGRGCASRPATGIPGCGAEQKEVDGRTIPKGLANGRGIPRRRETIPGRSKRANPSTANGATIGYEAQLWRMADALRGSMDAAQYKHVVLGLIFLKYISDAFEEQRARLEAEPDVGADPEDPDEYRAANVFWVPPDARWDRLRQNDRPALDKHWLGQLIDLITNIPVGNADARARDVLGRVYEYFLGQFAGAKGRRAGSSTRRGAWSDCSSRCSSRSRGGSTTPAAGPR